jgi:hypothetical protein
MNEQEIKSTDSQTQDGATKSPTPKPARRPWVKPTFERVSLKEAMAGLNYPRPFDGTSTCS